MTKIAPGDLDVAILGQLPAAHLLLGNQFEPRPMEVIGFQAAFGARALVEESLKHTARYPDDASVMAYIGRSGWNTLRTGGAIPDDELLAAIDASYSAIVSKLPKKDRP